MIDRSTTRDTPMTPLAAQRSLSVFGTRVAETILASVHVRARQQAGHMDASDLIKALPKYLARRGPSTLWGSALTHHPHVHCIIPSGGVAPNGECRCQAQSALAYPNIDDLGAIRRRHAPGQTRSAVFHAAPAAQAGAQIPIDIRAASRGSAIELSTTPALSGADRFARGRAS